MSIFCCRLCHLSLSSLAVDIIQAEAVRRLHHIGLSVEEIEDAKILPRPVIAGSYHPCISHVMSRRLVFHLISVSLIHPKHREIPQWPAYIDSNLPELPNAQGFQATDLHSRLLCQVNLMCSNLNCVRPSCATHRMVHIVSSCP